MLEGFLLDALTEQSESTKHLAAVRKEALIEHIIREFPTADELTLRFLEDRALQLLLINLETSRITK